MIGRWTSGGSITFNGGRREQSIVDGQQEGQHGLPGLAIENLRLLNDILQTAQNPVTKHRLLVDRLLSYKTHYDLIQNLKAYSRRMLDD
jgi:hypothetical protein